MGVQLVAFVWEVFHQRELLERAEARDDMARAILFGQCHARGTGERRVWTRVDRRLVDEDRCYSGMTFRPRTQRLLSRFFPQREEGPHAPLLRAAMQEAQREAAITVLEPALYALGQAHERFLNYVREEVDGIEEMQFPWSTVRESYRAAAERVLSFLPPNCVRSGDCFWNGDYSTFESPVILQPAEEVLRDEATATVKGVSLQDAAERIRQDDPEGQAELVRSWRNSRNPKLPKSIGISPEHSQKNLYEPTAILLFLKKIEGDLVDEDWGLRAHFSRVSRKPRPQ